MAGPTKIDFFGFYVDRAAVSSQLAQGVTAAQAGVNGETDLLKKVDGLILGGERLQGFMRKIAARFGDALSATAPGLSESLADEAIADDPVRRIPGTLEDFGLRSLSHLFDRRPLLLPVNNMINRLELRLMKGLADLSNLNWGFADANAALQKRLQQLRVYFIDFHHGRFKDRNGNTLGAPGGGIDPFNLSPQLTGQLAHVLVEFTGDMAYRVPLKKPADGSALESFTSVKAGVIGSVIEAIRLNDAPGGADLSALVADVVVYAGKHAESATRAQVGSLIRGGGLAGINNEAIAEAITAAIGGLVKKSSEKVAFETLSRYIKSTTVDAAVRDNVLAVLAYLHRNGPKPAGFLA